MLPPRSRAVLHGGTKFTIGIAVVILLANLFVAGLAGLSIYQSRMQYESRVAIQTRNLSESVSLTIGSMLDKAAVLLYAVKQEMERQLAGGTIDERALNGFIHDGVRQVPELDGLRVVDAGGRFVYGDRVVSGTTVSVADREYFKLARDRAGCGLIVSKPLLARSSHKWVFNLVSRVNHPDGTFAGAVIGAVSLDSIQKLFCTFDLGINGVLTLRDGDLAIIVRQPEIPGVESSIGNKTLSRQFTALIAAGNTSGTYINPGSIDPVERTFSFNKLPRYPLYVTVGLAHGDILASWRNETRIMLTMVVLFMLASLLSGLIMVRSHRGRLAVEAELVQHRDDLEKIVHQRTSELETKNARLLSEMALRRQADAELRKAAIIMDRMSDAVVWISKEGRFLYVNDAACRMHGYSRDELLTLSVSDIAPRFASDAWQGHWEEVKREGCLPLETTNVRRDGTEFPVEVTANFVVIDGVEYNCGLVRDITDRKEAEAEKQNLLLQLNQSQKIESIGRLAGGVAHDFNNLLMPIFGYCDLLAASLPPESPDLQKVEKITQAASKAKALTQQLLSFGRKQFLEMKTVNVNEVIVDFFEMFRRTIRENIEIRLNLHDTAPLVRADRNQLEQIILNLAINAQDAIEDKGIVTIETAPVVLDEEYARRHANVRPGDYTMLSVSDNGSGMDQETVKHIFEPFFTTKAVGKGSGLGLATVYGLVRQHEGHIWVYSEVGKGTVFKIFLPATDHLPKSETVAPAAPPEAVSPGRSVLLVEDNDMVRDLVFQALDGCGCEVIVAEGPQQAIEKAANRDIHLLLTDVVMPDMNGPELYAKLAAGHPGLKVLFMSGYTDNVMAQHGVLEEGTNFIQKPFAIKELIQRINAIVST